MKLYLFFGCTVVLIFCSCTEKSISSYSRHNNGFYYKLLAIGDQSKRSSTSTVSACQAVIKTQSDSIIFSTKGSANKPFYIPLNHISLAGGKNLLLNSVAGDSLSFLISTQLFFRSYFDTITPVFCKNDSIVKFDVRITGFFTMHQYDSIRHEVKNLVDDTELKELKLINDYLLKNKKNTEPNNYGIYILESYKTTLEKVAVGKQIRLQYSGFFMDGNPLDNGNQILEFTFGTPDQLVKGLNIVIGNLKKGETAKIILPSRLAFGELGSSNGSVPPYTPLVYNIKIIDIK